MTQTDFTDEILMAYVDDELDIEMAKAVDAAVLSDSDVAKRVRLFSETRARLGALSDATPLDPVPDALMARISATLDAARAEEEKKVLPFRQVRDVKNQSWQPLALAASVALAVGFGAGFGVQMFVPEPDGTRLNFDQPLPLAVELALNEMPTGTVLDLAEGSLTVIGTFYNDGQELCREFEFDDATGGTRISVVCKQEDRWDTRLIVATNARNGETYAPASSFETLDAYLVSIGASAQLSSEEEAAALRAANN